MIRQAMCDNDPCEDAHGSAPGGSADNAPTSEGLTETNLKQTGGYRL